MGDHIDEIARRLRWLPRQETQELQEQANHRAWSRSAVLRLLLLRGLPVLLRELVALEKKSALPAGTSARSRSLRGVRDPETVDSGSAGTATG